MVHSLGTRALNAQGIYIARLGNVPLVTSAGATKHVTMVKWNSNPVVCGCITCTPSETEVTKSRTHESIGAPLHAFPGPMMLTTMPMTIPPSHLSDDEASNNEEYEGFILVQEPRPSA